MSSFLAGTGPPVGRTPILTSLDSLFDKDKFWHVLNSIMLDQQRWEEGVQLMEDVLEAVGGAENGWQGRVSHEDYEQMKTKREVVKEQFLDHMAQNGEEREMCSAERGLCKMRMEMVIDNNNDSSGYN